MPIRLVLILALVLLAPTASIGASPMRSIVVAGTTKVPIGASEFCRTHGDDCIAPNGSIAITRLTPALRAELSSVNDRFNKSIAPREDRDLYHTRELWTYPVDAGDCEDYALAKRRDLIARGWSPSALLMTMVRQRNGEAHAVLVAATDQGDLVLDNLESEVLEWDRTNLRFIKMQTTTSMTEWVAIEDDRPLWGDSAPAVITASTSP